MNPFILLTDEIVTTTSSATENILTIALIVVGALIAILTVVSLIISIYLFFKYTKYNRQKNSIGLTGQEIARKILDKHDLSNIKVKAAGSLCWGNSYSHVWKKVRLRRLVIKKKSVTSLGMAAQKSALAILDKEKDKDMLKRNRMIPIVMFGPFAFIPLVAVGAIVDFIVFNGSGTITIISACVGLIFYIYSFILSLVILRVEKKGQERAIEIVKEDKLATEDEIESLKELYHIYNIEYVNNMIMALLEVIYRILQIALEITKKNSSN